METILTPCRVPWAVSPSMSGVTLSHSETSTEPKCTVVFGAFGRQEDGRRYMRRVEITFEMCFRARVGPHGDGEGVEALGYTVDPPIPCAIEDYLAWLESTWRETGYCPTPGFYVAQRSAWLESLPGVDRDGYRHYVVDGRDGYVELIARGFRWREWLWNDGEREQAPARGPVVGEGEEPAEPNTAPGRE